VERSGK